MKSFWTSKQVAHIVNPALILFLKIFTILVMATILRVCHALIFFKQRPVFRKSKYFDFILSRFS